jgi:hypothetical protein
MAACSSTQKIRFQLRRATEQQWYDTNPRLLEGEPAVSTDTRQIKIGTGALWRDTDYINLAGGVGAFGTPTTLADVITLTATSKNGITVNLSTNVTLTENQAVRFTAPETDTSGNGNNIIALNIYFAFQNYTDTSVINIKRTTAASALKY